MTRFYLLGGVDAEAFPYSNLGKMRREILAAMCLSARSPPIDEGVTATNQSTYRRKDRHHNAAFKLTTNAQDSLKSGFRKVNTGTGNRKFFQRQLPE
jgi:hypothetical protein